MCRVSAAVLAELLLSDEKTSPPETDMNSVEKKLADLVQQHPNLYDPGRQDYKDIARGHLSWTQISGALGKTEDEVKLVWKNLRDKFCKAKRRTADRRRGGLPDRPGPVLLVQLSWLSPFVKPRGTVLGDPGEGAGSGDELEKEKEKHRLEPKKEQEEGGDGQSRAAAEAELNAAEALRDEDELFLLSLLPSMKRLTVKQRMGVRIKFQQVLYAAEFEED